MIPNAYFIAKLVPIQPKTSQLLPILRACMFTCQMFSTFSNFQCRTIGPRPAHAAPTAFPELLLAGKDSVFSTLTNNSKIMNGFATCNACTWIEEARTNFTVIALLTCLCFPVSRYFYKDRSLQHGVVVLLAAYDWQLTAKEAVPSDRSYFVPQ